jgi:hypothetical protein
MSLVSLRNPPALGCRVARRNLLFKKEGLIQENAVCLDLQRRGLEVWFWAGKTRLLLRIA